MNRLPSTNKTIKRKKLTAAALLLAIANISHASAWDDFWTSAAKTLPAGVYAESDSADENPGYFSKTWDGLKTIVVKGNTGLLVPVYTIHPAWDYPNRREENGYTWGGGISSNYIDDRGNRRIVYAMAFSDSHNDIEPFLGYAWLSRWKLGTSPLHLEAGYTLGLTFRADYDWLPIPAPLPLLGVGTDNLTFYGTYVPGANIFFFFGNLVFDDKSFSYSELPEESKFNNRILIYGGGGWQKTDMRGVGGTTITSNGGWTTGGRYFFTKNWAFDFNVIQSKHDLKNHDSKYGSYKLTGYNFAAQYHFLAGQNASLYAGVGFGFYRLNNLKLADGWSSRKNSFTPIIQVGGTVALTKHIHLTGGLDLAFPRFRGHDPEGNRFSARPSPATFKVALGFAF